ncbi:MFS transporter [Nocardioides cheoyonin]|uniref:MFS transporter n=1 Tax=Nocardioides cheoyonin TaxID=3156615 RepID=UPI0032B4D5A3
MTSVDQPSTDEKTAPKGVYGARFLAPLFLGPLLNPINTTMVSVALVPISRDLGVPSSTVVWLVAGLYLTSAIAQPTLGRVGDILGPRRVYLAGLVVVGVAGVLPSLAGGFGPVVASRVLLGVGTSAAYPSVMAMIRGRSRVAGAATPPAVLSGISISALSTTAVGPVLGGVLIDLFDWRAIFLVNVPLAVAALVMTLLWVPDEVRPAAGERPRLRDLDLVGILLFAASVASLLVFGLTLSTPHWWLLPVTVVALLGLLGWELRRTSPFIDFRMLASNGGLTRTYLRMLLLYLGFYSMMYGYTQWIQDDAGFSSAQAGFLQLPTAVLAGAMSVAVARTTRVRVPILVACGAPIVGGVLMIWLHSSSPVAYLLVIAGLFGIAQGLASVSNQQVLYRQSPPDRVGTASGLSRTFVYLGAILSSGVLGATFGDAPTDANVHVIGVLIAVCSVAAGLLAVTDRTLRDASRMRTR